MFYLTSYTIIDGDFYKKCMTDYIKKVKRDSKRNFLIHKIICNFGASKQCTKKINK